MKTYIQIVLGFGSFVCVAVTGTAFAAADRELLLSAPIEQVDRTADTVTVLGQKFHTDATQLNVGQLVRVYGALSKDGSAEDPIVQPTEGYAANGDPVFIKGVVTNTDSLLGRAEIDGMTIDYTAELSNSDFVAPGVGDVIAVAASQPLNKSVLVAFATGEGAYDLGTSISGFSVASSGLRPSLANGAASGTTAAGMNGGGLTTSGMNGGGLAASGMNGGGLSASGMNGGGLAASGMNGGGLSASGMNGGGLAASGMNGGGLSASGMNGGGLSAAGTNGGGRN